MQARAAHLAYDKVKPISGWFSREAAMLFACLDETQRREGIHGDLFEIGVHHGRSAVFLASMLSVPGQSIGVCDLFDSQAGNVSRSGAGNRAIFEANLRRALGNAVNARIFQQASSTLRPADIGTSHRFVHIDGGHNADEALGDLRLAAQVTVKGGIIALDDAINPVWPGVAEGLMSFLEERADYCVALLGFNKAILCQREIANVYVAPFESDRARSEYGLTYPWHLKQLPLAGFGARIFWIPSYVSSSSIGARLHGSHHANPWTRSPILRPVWRLLVALTGSNQRS